MFTWSHLFAHADAIGREADHQVVEPTVRRSRSVPPYRIAIGRALVALGTAIAGPEDQKELRSASVAR